MSWFGIQCWLSMSWGSLDDGEGLASVKSRSWAEKDMEETVRSSWRAKESVRREEGAIYQIKASIRRP
jgi:hypothetical protein